MEENIREPEPASYPNPDYIPVPYNGRSPESWTPIPNALPENPSAISNNLTAVESALVNRPTDGQIKAALEANEKSYPPGSDYIVWYVIKYEEGWHVDGVVRRHPFLYYDANGGDAETIRHRSTALPPHRHSDTPGCGGRVHWDVSLPDTSSTWAC